MALILWSITIITGLFLSGCIGASSGSSNPATFSETTTLPQLGQPPVARLSLGNDYIGMVLGIQPIEFESATNASRQYSQLMYELSDEGELTRVPFLDSALLELDLTGNIAFTSEANIVPLDLMVMDENFIMVTIRYRDLDGNDDNDFYNLLVHLRTGLVSAAPLGLNKEGNSGRTALNELGRDLFPPDSRWNDTEDLYLVDVDYDLVDLPIEEEEGHKEPVDHYNDPPLPPCPSENTDENQNTSQDAEEDDDTAQPESESETQSDSETTDSEPETSTQTQNCTPVTSESQSTTSLMASLQSLNATKALADDEDEVIPTAVYRFILNSSAGGFALEKVSAPDDRPGLGQFIVSRAGIIIYRNLDGGDNSYRVILDGCDDVTGRLSTVLNLLNSTLIVADDENGNSSVFELTERGANKLIFTCNGEVIREAYSGYSTRIRELRMAFNDPSIAPYNYLHPYFITDKCQGGRLFPRQDPEIQIFDPLPDVPGLPSDDVRTLRKNQRLLERLYCIGYDVGLDLTVMELDTSLPNPLFSNINMPFGLWLPDFDSLHMVSPTEIIFTGHRLNNRTRRTVKLNTDGDVEDITNTFGGLEIQQQISLTPPPATTSQ